MRFTLISIMIVGLLAGSLVAQDGIFGSLNIGWKNVRLSPLNDWIQTELDSLDFNEFNANTFTVGGGGYVIIAKRFILGGKGQIMLPQEKPSQASGEEVRLKINGGYGEGILGYALISRSFRLYPYIGLGASGFILQTKKSLGDDPKFKDVLLKDSMTVVYKGGISTDVGVAMDFYLKTIKILSFINGLETGPFIGVQAGYIFLPQPSHWMRDTDAIENEPAFKYDGPYFEVKLGLGFSASGD